MSKQIIKSTVSSCYFETDVEVYTVVNVINRGYNLEPPTCIHCGHTGEVTYMQDIGDGQCAMCGERQLNPEIWED